MLVDELLIPHPDGCVVVRFDERVTVVAGLDDGARARLGDLLVTGLAGAGPATVVVRDDEGEPGRIEPGTTDAAGAVAEVRRLVVVGPAELGFRDEPPRPTLIAERTATAIAHRELIREQASIEAGAAERTRLLAELGDDPAPDGVASPARDQPDLDAVADSAGRIDELLGRRHTAEEVLERTAVLLSTLDDEPGRPSPPSAGDLRIGPGPLAAGLLAAVDVVRRVGGPDAHPRRCDADLHRAGIDARAALVRAVAEVDRARADARAELDTCDHELATLARSAGVPVGAEGPGPALTAALERRRHVLRPTVDDDPAARLVARPRASLRSRLAELPDDTEVTTVARRLAAVAERLSRLDAAGGVDVERTRDALLARIALLRPEGVASIAPVVLDEAFAGLAADDLVDLLDLVTRVADRTQVVVLTGDPAVAAWARHRAHRGQLHLIELAR